jgi:hypothetical protein
MALVKGTNSYVDVSDADAYFSTRIGSDAWTLSDPALKESALVTATTVLDAMSWVGVPFTLTQPLAFPRRIADVSETLPSRFIMAVQEMALHLLQNPDLLEDTGSVNSLEVGPVSLTSIRAPELLPKLVQRLIAPFTAGNGTINGVRPWWRAN